MSKQKRYIRRFKKLILLVVLIIITIAALIAIDAIKEQYRESTQTSQEQVTVVESKTITFTTDYFSFTTPTSWRAIDKESNANLFVYRSYRGDLIEQELNVHINPTSADTSAIRVLPVTFNPTSRLLVPEEVSEHCSKYANTKIARQPVRVSLLGTSMMCQIDGTNYLITAGLKDGNENITVDRVAGGKVTLRLFYRNSSTPPDAELFVKLVRTFKIL